ncbi:hypothetical protein MLD38_001891 [Melastoma candidum]|uniref:Uncharacterized protein n=1 Tax=Melastoma candidum TaxID=119954 RepID=A0ACB9SNB0_9MYRT|nr:hypothetical protein MLD38_001891 [Melastoma candidum]
MELFSSRPCHLFLIFLLLSTKAQPFSSSASISDHVFESRRSAGRHLLQAKKSCPVNLEFLDYKILTNSCKGPNYLPDVCCPAFKDLACPYSEYLNDLTNDCASTLFSYINLRGNYPPGLFSSECTEGKEGLVCPASSPVASINAPPSSSVPRTLSKASHTLPMLVVASLVLWAPSGEILRAMHECILHTIIIRFC